MILAIYPQGVGRPVGYRPIESLETELEPGERFAVDVVSTVDIAALVLAEDGVSLRERTGGELLDGTEGPREQARDRIREAFTAAFNTIVGAKSLNWHAGERSAVRLDGAVRLAETLGEETLWLTDVDDVAHELDLDEAREIAAAVGVHWRSRYFDRQERMGDIDIAASQDELDAVQPPAYWTPVADGD